MKVKQGHVCSDTQPYLTTACIKGPLLFTDPNSTVYFTHAASVSPYRRAKTPLPSTQLKSPAGDLLFLGLEATALKGSALLAPDVQRSRSPGALAL